MISVFHVNITSGQDDEGKRILLKDVTTLDTYEFQESIDHEVRYQANRVELLRVSDGKITQSRLG